MGNFRQAKGISAILDAITTTHRGFLALFKGNDGNAAPVTLTVAGEIPVKDATLGGFVDGIEALIGTTNTALAAVQTAINTVDTHVDGLETLVTATNALLTAVSGFVDGVEGLLTTLGGKDFATQTTLAAVLAKLTADPATQTTLAAVLAKLSADPATQTTLAAIAAKDFATQTTLAAVLAKLTADPATQTTLAAVLTGLGAQADAAASSDSGSFSVIAFIKRLLGYYGAMPAVASTNMTQANGTNLDGKTTTGHLPVTTPKGIRTVTAALGSANAYVTGKCIGGLQTLNNVTNGSDLSFTLEKVFLDFKSVQSAPVDVVIYNANPNDAGTTITDTSTFVLSTVDYDKVIDVVHLTDATALGANCSAMVARPYTSMLPSAGTSTIYANVVARGAITLGAADPKMSFITKPH